MFNNNKKEIISWFLSLIFGLIQIWSVRLTLFYFHTKLEIGDYLLLLSLLFLFIFVNHYIITHFVLHLFDDENKTSVLIILILISIGISTILAFLFKTYKNENITLLPKHTLKIDINSTQSITINLVGFRTELGKININQFSISGNWQFKEDKLIFKGSPKGSLEWQGITGNLAELSFITQQYEGVIDIKWDGVSQIIDLKRNKEIEFISSKEFPVSKFNRWSVFLIVVLAFSIFLYLPTYLAFYKPLIYYQPTNINVEQRIILAIIIFGVGILLIIFLNNVLTLIRFNKNWEMTFATTVPLGDELGGDFLGGIYTPAEYLSKHMNSYIYEPPLFTERISVTGYPPLVYVLGYPFAFFPDNTAVIINFTLLIITSLCCLLLTINIANNYLLKINKKQQSIKKIAVITLFVFFCIYVVTSYPFTFSLERGNFDIYTMLFSLLAIMSFLKYPKKIWLQVLLVSIAAHLKIYPAILFVVLYVIQGKKIVLPTILINTTLLLLLGFRNAYGFFHAIYSVSSRMPASWTGNHSSNSFADLLIINSPSLVNYSKVIQIFFFSLPIIIWLISIIIIYKNRSKPESVIVGLMISIPLMNVIPSISHDYKLVILNISILFLIFVILQGIIRKGLWINYIYLFTLLIILLFFGRSYVFINDYFNIIGNKYLWVVLLQILILINIKSIFNDQKIRKTDMKKTM